MQITLSTSISPVADYVAESLMSALARGPVLWLVSGGSAIPVAVAAADRLRAAGWSLASLTVTLADERYGAVGHADSNWAQLEAAGFNLPGAQLEPVLQPSLSPEATAEHFAAVLERHFGQSFCCALLGIGPDGHTAGIKPHSPALTASGLVSSYSWDDYRRITISARALSQLNQATVYAVGEAKWPVVAALQANNPPMAAEQPAQLLRPLSNLTIFTDAPENTA